MKTQDAISPTATVASMLISLIGFVLIYAVLMGFDLFLLLRNAKKGLAAGEMDSVPVDVDVDLETKGAK
jgi:cytochrome bd-type quinol oxidase subunit 1